jgi:uncharacterized phage protein gp47/JayE
MAIERPVFELPDWHKGETAEQIQARMMEQLPADIDNIEGGFPYDFTMPTALEEDELLNFYLVETLKVMFPMWAYGQYLDYHAKGVGLTRREANHAFGYVTVTGVPGTDIPAGTVFCVPAVGDTPAIEYATDEAATIPQPEAAEDGTTPDYGAVEIPVTAVAGGTGCNVSADTIVIMASPITGVVTVTNDEAITGGTAEEDDDSLYERIVLQEQSAESFVGNDADYIRWAKEVNGVGTVLIDTQYEEEHPNWVKLIVLDANGQPANDQILANVYDHIMGPNNRKNERLAPIGAVLFVEAPAGCALTIEVTGVKLEEGATAEDVVKRFKASLETYYIEAKEAAEVNWNRVHAIFTETEGVADFERLTVNGGTSNIPVAVEDYPVTEGVSLE